MLISNLQAWRLPQVVGQAAARSPFIGVELELGVWVLTPPGSPGPLSWNCGRRLRDKVVLNSSRFSGKLFWRSAPSSPLPLFVSYFFRAPGFFFVSHFVHFFSAHFVCLFVRHFVHIFWKHFETENPIFEPNDHPLPHHPFTEKRKLFSTTFSLKKNVISFFLFLRPGQRSK